MHEDVRLTAVDRDEPEAFFRVEPFHSALSHTSASVAGSAGITPCNPGPSRAQPGRQLQRESSTPAFCSASVMEHEHRNLRPSPASVSPANALHYCPKSPITGPFV